MDAKKLKNFACKVKADLIGIASIDRFKHIRPEHHPKSIMPEAKSVIVIGKRITRGSLRGIEEGTQLNIYKLYGYQWLNNRILAAITYRVAEYLEDNGFEAVPLPNIPNEVPPMGIPVKKGKPAPNVIVDVEDAAIRAGLGEKGYCGIFLTERFGPRQRFQIIITDAELEPDCVKNENICDLCKKCARICPHNAISTPEKTLNICGKKMVIASIEYEKCKICKNGAMPDMYYEKANPDRIGAVCARTCLDHLEKTGRIKNLFTTHFRKRKPWVVNQLFRENE